MNQQVTPGLLLKTMLVLVSLVTAASRAVCGPAPPASLLAQNQQDSDRIIEHEDAIHIIIDGFELTTQTAPLTRSDVLFIPLEQAIASRLGADLKSDASTGVLVITLTRAQSTFVFTEGQTQFLADGAPGELPEAAFVQSGYLMAPARALFEAFGYSLDWFEETRVLRVTSAMSAPVIAPGAFDTVFQIPFAEPVPSITSTTQATEPIDTAGKPVEIAPFEYTFDNTTAFENIAVSGASDQSNFLPTSAIRNMFNMRFRTGMNSGYSLNGTLRTLESSDPIENKGAVDKLALNLAKGSISLDLADFAPRFSYFALKNYQLRGARYTRDHKDYALTVLAGKSPKVLADSEYARMVQGFRINRSKQKKRDLGLSFVRTRDGGSLLSTDRVDNRVYTANAAGTMGKFTEMQAEFSMSETSLNGGSSARGNGLSLRGQFRNRQTLCTALFEKTGTQFVSETTYVTSGRRDMSTLCNKKLNDRTMLGGGYQAVRMGSDETRTVPLFFSVVPFKNRPRFKTSLRRNYERTFGGSTSRYLDVKSAGFSDEIGSVGLDLTLERRKQKETGGSVTFRNSYRYRLNTFLSKRTEVSLQVKRERRSRGSNQRTRFYSLRVDHELKPWNDLSFTATRYYNGTINNRTDFSLGFRKIDIVNDREFGVEYKYFNFRDHNDNVIRLNYSFFR